jgi:hypothetical protein
MIYSIDMEDIKKKLKKKSKQVTSIKISQIKESYFNDDSIMMTLFTT